MNTYIVIVSKHKLAPDSEHKAKPLLICGQPITFKSRKKAHRAATAARDNYQVTEEFRSGLRKNNIEAVRFAKVIQL